MLCCAAGSAPGLGISVCVAWRGGKVGSFPTAARGLLGLGLRPPFILVAFSHHLPGVLPPSRVVLVEPDGRGVLACIAPSVLETFVVFVVWFH